MLVRVGSGVLGKPLGISEPVSSVQIVPTQAARATALAGKRAWVSLREAMFACLVWEALLGMVRLAWLASGGLIWKGLMARQGEGS